jgi:hypothetical protein
VEIYPVLVISNYKRYFCLRNATTSQWRLLNATQIRKFLLAFLMLQDVIQKTWLRFMVCTYLGDYVCGTTKAFVRYCSSWEPELNFV